MRVYACEHSTHRGKRHQVPQDLDLQAAVSCLMCVLELNSASL